MRKGMMKRSLAAVLAYTMLLPQSTLAATSDETGIAAQATNVTPAYRWDFETVDGTTIGSSGSVLDGAAVLQGTAAVNTEQIAIGSSTYSTADNHVLSLAGGTKGSSYVTLPSDLYNGVSSETGLTWSFWMNAATDVGSYTRVFSSANSSNADEFAYTPYAADAVWNLIYDDTNLYRHIYGSEPTKGIWNYITVTVSADGVVFYVNGAKVSSSINAGSATELTARLDSMSELVNNALGMTCSGWSDNDCKVALDDVEIYKTALSAEEVKAVAEGYGLEVPEPVGEGDAQEGTYQDGTVLTLVDGVTATSVDGKIKVKIWKDASERYYYSVSRNDKVVLECSALGMTTEAEELVSGLALDAASVQVVSGRETYDLLQGSTSYVDKAYNELSFDLTKNNSKMTVIFRIFEDGIGYRYEVDGDVTSSTESTVITGEESEFTFPDKGDIWTIPLSVTYEGAEYTKRTVADQYDTVAKYSTPILASLGEDSGNHWVLLSEANVYNEAEPYCASVFETVQGEKSMRMTFGQYLVQELDDSYDAQSYWATYDMIQSVTMNDVFHTPWRVAVITDNLEDLANSSLITDLNPAAEGDFSWVKPGSSSWSWWSTSADAIDFKAMKDYIDFASEIGMEYCLVDYGWELWDNYEAKIAELVAYADKRDVGLLLWYGVNKMDNAHVFDLDNPETIAQEFAWCEKMGVKGVKVDYINSDSQFAMQVMYYLADIAAEYHQVLNYHGCTNPNGENRTYPNILSSEAVCGAENFKWSAGSSIASLLTLPYTRNVLGSMEFTPTAYWVLRPGLDSCPATSGFMLAMSVVYESAVQTFADSVYVYEGYNGLSLIADVPTTWDESLLLEGYPGESVIRARRSGENWYVGAMTNAAAVYEVSLDFLDANVEYTAYIYNDDATGKDIEVTTQKVTSDSVLSLNLMANGGATIKLTKNDPIKTFVYDSFEYIEAEASENVVTSGATIIEEGQHVSGRKLATYVGNGAENTLTFNNIQAKKDGQYELKIFFVSGESRDLYVKVNDGEGIKMTGLLGIANDWISLSSKSITVDLKAGANTITLYNDTAYAPNIDRIGVAQETAEPIAKKVLADFDFDDETDGFTSADAKASGTYTLTDSYSAYSGKAIYLNGTSDFLEVTTLDDGTLLNGVEELTVSFEAKTDRAETNWAFYAAPNALTQEYLTERYLGALIQNNSTLTVERYNNNGTRAEAASATVSDWSRIDVVLTAAKTQLYVNGVLMSEVDSAYTLEEVFGESGIFYIGRANWGSGEYYQGWIDNMTILNYALDAETIQANAETFQKALNGELDNLELPFTDVAETDWYYDAVYYNYTNGLMTGMTEDTFAPVETLFRAQLAIILYRMEGSPEVAYSDIFSDVADGQWYTSAVLWAQANGIVTGYSGTGTFGPNDKISREQMAVMMYRYAAYKGYDVNTSADISDYPDAASVSAYAETAMKWAVETGIITGQSGAINPQGDTNRAMAAMIIQRFMEYYN